MRIAASLIRSAGRSNPLCIIMTVTLRCCDFFLNPKVRVRFRDAPVDVWPQQLLEDHLTPELHCWSRFCCRLSSQDRKHQHQTHFQNKITLAKESFFVLKQKYGILDIFFTHCQQTQQVGTVNSWLFLPCLETTEHRVISVICSFSKEHPHFSSAGGHEV